MTRLDYDEKLLSFVRLSILTKPLSARTMRALRRTLNVSEPAFFALRAIAIERRYVRIETLGRAMVCITTRKGKEFVKKSTE